MPELLRKSYTPVPQYYDEDTGEYEVYKGYEKSPKIVPGGIGQLALAAMDTLEPLVSASMPCRFVDIYVHVDNAEVMNIAGLDYAAGTYDKIWISNANDVECEGASGDVVQYRVMK